MAEGRALLVANSVYQLLTAVHIRRTLLAGWEAELLLTDVTPQLQGLMSRLEETGIFCRLLFAETKELSRQYAVGKEEEIAQGYRQAERLLRWALQDELGVYDAVYFANPDTFMRMLACLPASEACRFIWYEDGFSTYVIDYFRESRAAVNRVPEGRRLRDKLSHVLLYEPRLAMRGDGLPNRRLPRIPLDDVELKEQLNHIFAYEPPEKEADFIFLEQSFRAEGLKNNDIQLMKECRDAVGPGRFVVKPHPRTPENLPLRLGLTRPYPVEAPWEMVLLNEGERAGKLLTVCSNAALTGRLVFGLDIPTVMLYRLFDGRVLWQEDEVLRRYLRRFQRQFAGNEYYVPETLGQLAHILRYLGGEHG